MPFNKQSDSNVSHVYFKGFLMLLLGAVGTLSSIPPPVRQGIVSTWGEAKAVPTVTWQCLLIVLR